MALSDDPHHNPTFETWTRLAAAHGMLRDVQEQLAVAEDGIAACSAELTDPRRHEMVNVLRTRELLSDVLGAGPVASAPPAADGTAETNRPCAARISSPKAAAQRATSRPVPQTRRRTLRRPEPLALDRPDHRLPS
ncbi:hypothetical protein [Streptomyces sp. NPDC088554]|uniref:hypothetical protein n=1 Tax=Streptomyces sp. NPDC088554 TaxID=3365865 RepID=UPI00380E6E4A